MLGSRSVGMGFCGRNEEERIKRCSFMPCTVSDKKTINTVALAKGIKSTHAQLLFKLIKAPSSFSTSSTMPADKEAGNGSDIFCLAGKSIADTLMRGGVVGFMRAAMLMISTTFAAPQCQSSHVVQGMHGGIFFFFLIRCSSV